MRLIQLDERIYVFHFRIRLFLLYYSVYGAKKDAWGVPLLKMNIDYDSNDEKMVKDYQEQLTEMFTKAGFTNIHTEDSKAAPGLDIHEMGGVRMGHDPKTSLLNEWNQLHACKNVFVTDGACMTSTSTQNPSLTYMALTARAVDHAVSELKKRKSKNYLIKKRATWYRQSQIKIKDNVRRHLLVWRHWILSPSRKYES